MSDSVMDRSARLGNVADSLHIRLFQAEALRLPAGEWNARNVRSPFWRLYRNQNDGAYLKMPDRSHHPLVADRVHFVPAGVSFSCGNTHDIDHFYIHFDVIGLSSLTVDAVFDGPICLPDDPGFESRIEAMEQRVKTGQRPLDLAGRCWSKALIHEGLARYLDALPPERRERGIRAAERGEPVAPALRCIEQNLSDPLTVATLAALCCLSPDYFARRFRECLGQTPGAFIMARRITAASQQLLFTGDSLEKIAEDCGFGNRFYFSRVFTRETGISPAAYRKTARV